MKKNHREVKKTPGELKSGIGVYKKLKLLGKGTYGEVFLAKNQMTGLHYACKQLSIEKEREGFPITAIREIKTLTSCRHENIVKLEEVFISLDKPLAWMIFEYVEHDLSGLIYGGMITNTKIIKTIMVQLIEGMYYLHSKNVMHRDLKCANLLITRKGILKIADFGLSRFRENDKNYKYSNPVVTRWYRSPELLLGEKRYTKAIDVWSIGCIFAELLLKKPLFKGKNALDQLEKIFFLTGSPDENNWPDSKNLPFWKKFNQKKKYGKRFDIMFRGKLEEEDIRFMSLMLELDPKKRPTLRELMKTKWFEKAKACKEYLKLSMNVNYNELTTLNFNKYADPKFLKKFDRKRNYSDRNYIQRGNRKKPRYNKGNR